MCYNGATLRLGGCGAFREAAPFDAAPLGSISVSLPGVASVVSAKPSTDAASLFRDVCYSIIAIF